MNLIEQTLSDFQIGKPQTYEGLTIHPLTQSSAPGKDYLTLDEALKLNLARVSEVSKDGSVSELLFRNTGEQAVLLLDGEELVGAKQNRVLNITILAPAGRDIVIPVSCVEAGRWNHSGEDFMTAPRAQFSASRANKAVKVSENLAVDSVARSDQSEVWADIDMKMSSLSSRSETAAVEQVFEDNKEKLTKYVDELGYLTGQVGAVFSIKGKLAGIEFFDRPDTCHLLMPKIIRSYALDAIDPGYQGDSELEINSPDEFIKLIASAPYSTHDSVGEGSDFRFDATQTIAGGALIARDRVIHLCVFVRATSASAGTGRDYQCTGTLHRNRYVF